MGGSLTSDTQFAKGQRSRAEDIIAAHHALASDEMLIKVMDAFPLMACILDENRHIVSANNLMVDVWGEGNIDVILGTRPGEMVGCRHAWDNELGCGTSTSCRFCGAVAAILAAQSGQTVTQECRIMTPVDQEPLDLRIKASPFRYRGMSFTFFALENIAHEKRREILERTFFHDVLNTAGNIQGVADLAVESETLEDMRELASLSRSLGEQIVNEIQSQRDLLMAENKALNVVIEDVELEPFLASVVRTYRHTDFALDKKIVMDVSVDHHTIATGAALLNRALGNLLKNALEASVPGDRVTIGCSHEEPVTHFWVQNPQVMTEEVQHQIFQRSFSTKGAGRGIGTYSIKLMVENYLQGTVSFTSTEGEGTIFSLSIPDRPTF